MSVQLAVFVVPKAGRDEVSGWRECAQGGRELEVRVRAAPEKGKATKAAGEVLAAFFHVSKRSALCVAGATSRHKRFELPLSGKELADRLGEVGL